MKTAFILSLFFVAVALDAKSAKADGFTTLQEFVVALDEMSPEQFRQMGVETDISYLYAWHEQLSELNPEFFTRWNQKLKLLPPVGLNRNGDQWLLRETISDLGPGFFPNKISQGFENIVDFVQSLKHDTPEAFSRHLRATPRELYNSWLMILNRSNPSLLTTMQIGLNLFYQIGFGKGGYSFLKGPYAAMGTMGFKPEALGANSRAIKTYEEFVALVENMKPMDAYSVGDLQGRMRATDAKVRTEWLKKLNKSNEKLFRSLAKLMAVRLSVGFSTRAKPNYSIVPAPRDPIRSVGFGVLADTRPTFDPANLTAEAFGYAGHGKCRVIMSPETINLIR